MFQLSKFQSGWTTFTNGTVYKNWKKSNPGEATKLEAFATSVFSDKATVPPVLASATGVGLVGMLTAVAMSAPRAAVVSSIEIQVK